MFALLLAGNGKRQRMQIVTSQHQDDAFVAERSEGTGHISFRKRGDDTVLDHLYQEGCAKIRLPRTYETKNPLAVLINTSGGLTGGDRLQFKVEAQPGARVVATSQAQEKIYRSPGGDADVLTELRVGPDAILHWVPQETILFDGARLRRRVDIDLDTSASFIGVEALIFGRTARGEAMTSGMVRESWRLRRDNRLVFADETKLDDAPASILEHPASASGDAAIATLVMAGGDLDFYRDALRALALETVGTSIVNDVLVTRMTAETGARLRSKLVAALNVLQNGAPLPKVWSC